MSDETTIPAAPEPPTGEPQAQVDALSEKLAEQAKEVTSQLRDLLPEAAAPAVELPPVEAPAAESSAAEPPTEAAPEVVAAAASKDRPEPPAASNAAQEVKRLLAPGESVESDSDDRTLSALAWASMALLQLPIVSVVQLLSDNTKHRRFQQHHAITSLLFYVAGFAYEIAAAIVFTVLGALTLGCGYACLWLIFLVPHALALYYALQAYNGKTIELPVLSSYARKQGWL